MSNASPKLRTMIENSYEIFAHQSWDPAYDFSMSVKPEIIEHCRGCPARALKLEAMQIACIRLMSTWGDADLFRHFLPRILELWAEGQDIDIFQFIQKATYDKGLNFSRWPERQVLFTLDLYATLALECDDDWGSEMLLEFLLRQKAVSRVESVLLEWSQDFSRNLHFLDFIGRFLQRKKGVVMPSETELGKLVLNFLFESRYTTRLEEQILTYGLDHPELERLSWELDDLILKLERIRVPHLIRSAFAAVTLGEGIGLWEANAIDDYTPTAPARAKDIRDDWQKILVADLHAAWAALCYVDPEGMAFLLPAFMIGAPEHAENCLCFYPGNRAEDQFQLLNAAQRQAIVAFLEDRLHQMHECSSEGQRRVIRRALDHHWLDKAKGTHPTG